MGNQPSWTRNGHSVQVWLHFCFRGGLGRRKDGYPYNWQMKKHKEVQGWTKAASDFVQVALPSLGKTWVFLFGTGVKRVSLDFLSSGTTRHFISWYILSISFTTQIFSTSWSQIRVLFGSFVVRTMGSKKLVEREHSIESGLWYDILKHPKSRQPEVLSNSGSEVRSAVFVIRFGLEFSLYHRLDSPKDFIEAGGKVSWIGFCTKWISTRLVLILSWVIWVTFHDLL